MHNSVGMFRPLVFKNATKIFFCGQTQPDLRDPGTADRPDINLEKCASCSFFFFNYYELDDESKECWNTKMAPSPRGRWFQEEKKYEIFCLLLHEGRNECTDVLWRQSWCGGEEVNIEVREGRNVSLRGFEGWTEKIRPREKGCLS